jgi:hypothetical protein
VGAGAAYLNQMLDRLLAFLIEQQDHAIIASIPGFLQGLTREPQLAIHLSDLHTEADALGRMLHVAEYDGGNPGKLPQLGIEFSADALRETLLRVQAEQQGGASE